MMSTLARLSFWLPPERMGDFEVSYRKKLVPILGNSMYSVIKIAWENAGQTLRAPQKIRLAKELKKIQSDTRAGIEKVLTPEQLKAWDKYKEEQKK